MRVLQVVPTLATRTGGPAAVVVGSSLALERVGVESHIFSTNLAEAVFSKQHSPVSPDELPPGADALEVRLFPASWPYRLAFSPTLYRAIRREVGRYDAVHIHSLFLFPQFAAFRESLRQGVPYVVSPCGALDPYLRARSRTIKAATNVLWQRRMLERATALHYTTHDEARLVADLQLRPPAVVIPSGIVWSGFQDVAERGKFRRQYLGDFDGPLVVSLGRVSEKKGLDILIRAFALLLRELPDARLAIVGPDDEGLIPRLQAVAVQEGVADDVSFIGLLLGDEKRAALADTDVWALPSHTENFGVAVVEALAAGLPTVISPAVNIAGDVAAAGAGIVAQNTAHAFARELLRILHEPELRARLGERGRAFAREYDWSVVAPRLAEMYESIARSKARRVAARQLTMADGL